MMGGRGEGGGNECTNQEQCNMKQKNYHGNVQPSHSFQLAFAKSKKDKL